MIQSVEVIRHLPIFGSILSSIVKNWKTDIATSLEKDFLYNQIDKFNKEYITG